MTMNHLLVCIPADNAGDNINEDSKENEKKIDIFD